MFFNMKHSFTPASTPHCAPFCPPAPLFLREEADGKVAGEAKSDEQLAQPGSGRKLLCRGCRSLITTSDMRIRMHGKHEHVFANPAGYVYQVGCFSTAPGCSHEGTPSWEFTWFQGHSWQIAACRGCNALMGWRFRTPSGQGFHGLILTHLIEETDDDG